ncbi:serine hydrolase domain-containing protein [Kriegella aquimaris]|uniref:CubicO group peptidase, beta-lactamase class C family n=1 Tax=Kriegella aquimaris TaxID=192904 RepID=A0A1G9K025_9FLAO|nr:serine hydrolase domain-containing protein [Kriegella aquimaris]SDL43032.1 CubicO group peptidase, beta-lactamase class C family [Kriegella aquimaris]
MIKTKALILFLFTLFNFGCKNENKENNKPLSIEKQNEINAYLETEVKNTLGLAIAVIKDGNVVYENYLGKENLNNKSVSKESIFPLYSLSKLITSTAVFQLIEENKIHLDDKIPLYIDNLPTEWKSIEVKHLLTHSSGLPDYDLMKGKVSESITMINLTQNKLRFKKGERWEYNQTNFWFISKIIEKVTKKSFESFVIETQFANDTVLFSSNFIDSIPNRSFKYNFNTSSENWEKVNLDFGKRANSAGGLNLTLNQFVAWNKQFDANEFIQPITKNKMWTPFEYDTPFYFEDEKDQFLYGWQQYSTNNEISYGFTGGLVTGYRKFINQNMTIIVLTNGLKNSPIRNKIINKIAGIVDEKLAE